MTQSMKQGEDALKTAQLFGSQWDDYDQYDCSSSIYSILRNQTASTIIVMSMSMVVMMVVMVVMMVMVVTMSALDF